MANKPGSFISKTSRNLTLIEEFDRGADPESLAQKYGVSERQVYRIVSPKSRRELEEMTRLFQEISGNPMV